MPQDVAQWLAEIQSLQRQVAELQRDRDQAYASADNLRELYDAEAQQRRRDVAAYTGKIEQLQKELAALQKLPEENLPIEAGQTASADSPARLDDSGFDLDIASIQSKHSVAQLQTALITSQKQCEQLKRMLIVEQAAHRQTRESLTAALGDTVDLLAKERSGAEG
ncbi:MAG: hypothetical protein WBD47_14020 [Phormidesmis sp.]